jgi:DNA-binding NtrC family response regulator
MDEQTFDDGPGDGGGGSRLAILLVEEESIIAFVQEEMLAEMGHLVLGRVPGMAGAQAAMERGPRPDLAMVDVGLARGESGIEVALRLGREHGLRCIVTSGRPFHDEADGACIGNEALAFLLRPFRRSSLRSALAAVAAALRTDAPEGDGLTVRAAPSARGGEPTR